MSEVEIKIKLTGLPEDLIPRLRAILNEYLATSGDTDINTPGKRSVKLKLKIARNDPVDNIRVIKKEKKVIRFRNVTAYIESICERAQDWLTVYFPTPDRDWDELDQKYRMYHVTLNLKVILQPLSMDTTAPAKSCVEIEEELD